MRIAYVCTDPGIPVFGSKGASIHVQEMLRAFLKLGAEVTLFSPRMGDPVLADLTAVRRHPLTPGKPAGKSDAAARARQQLALNRVAAEALDAEGPFDLVYERHALFAHGAMEWARGRGIPSILEVNAPLIDEQKQHRSLACEAEAVEATAKALQAAAHVIAVSPAVADYCAGYGADARVVPNGVNPDRFAAPARHDGPFTVGFLGTLKPWHDVDTLIDAFGLIADAQPEARLLVVGEGPERERLEARLADIGLTGRAQFTGAVPADRVPAELARMSVGIACYRQDQPFYFSPLKLYEYMAAGLPVVVSRTGGLEELTGGGRFGLDVPPEDPAALALALTALAVDPARRLAMGAAARQHVLEHHSWDGIARDLLARAGVLP